MLPYGFQLYALGLIEKSRTRQLGQCLLKRMLKHERHPGSPGREAAEEERLLRGDGISAMPQSFPESESSPAGACCGLVMDRVCFLSLRVWPKRILVGVT